MLESRQDSQLLINLKAALPGLERLLLNILDEYQYEDLIYRFYHSSSKTYRIQVLTKEIVAGLQAVLPEQKLNAYFLQILSEGTEKYFELTHNRRWAQETRPLLEAFFHAKYFLEMAVKYGKELEAAPEVLPSGWAGFLYLYNLR